LEQALNPSSDCRRPPRPLREQEKFVKSHNNNLKVVSENVNQLTPGRGSSHTAHDKP
jgi:hypothetical protein